MAPITESELTERVVPTQKVRIKPETRTIGSICAREMNIAWKGFINEWTVILALEPRSHSVLYDCGVSVSLTLPITALCTWCVATLGYTFGREIHNMLGLAAGFLLIFRLQTSYARFWEARTHCMLAKKSAVSVAILAVTQYHRHFGDPSTEVKVTIEDIRRYLCLYWFTMTNQLHGVDMRQENIEEFITQDELTLLRKRQSNHAVTVVKWIGARLSHLEALGYISPLQLHETNEGIEGLVEAFNGLTKIKTTKIPFVIRQLCTGLTVFFVYTSPFALATTFRNFFTEFRTILGRTLLSSFLVGVFYFSINATARSLEDPLGFDPHDLPLEELGHELKAELTGLFSEHVPPVVGQRDEKNDKPHKALKARAQDVDMRGGRLRSADGKTQKHPIMLPDQSRLGV